MVATLDLDIRPGSGIGPFELGTSLWTVLDQLRALQHSFPQVDVKFDPDDPAKTPIILHARPHLDLLFSGQSQRLHTICVRRLKDDTHPPPTLRYKGDVLSSGKEVLRRVGIARTFGPTYAGEELRYPGVWFAFDEDGRPEGRPIKGATSGAKNADRDQEVRRIVVCEHDFKEEERDALDEVRECAAMDGDISRAVVRVHEGVTLHFHPSSAAPINIRLGATTAQDLTVDLGPPLRIHYKEDDRMNIHAAATSKDANQDGDYFYNYFQHGLDFLISGSTHMVKKIILHTNIPGTAMFQRYKRCPWEIEGKPEDDEDDSPPRMRFYDSFEQIGRFLSPREPPPSMVLDRTDYEDGLTLPSAGTRLYGYDGVVLEVSEAGRVLAAMMF